MKKVSPIIITFIDTQIEIMIGTNI